jgi:hypothetical protein
MAARRPALAFILALANCRCRFVDRKGIHELISAIGIVLAEAPDVRFALTGGHRGCTALLKE